MAKQQAQVGPSTTVEDGMLVIRLPINDPPRPSASGKTLIVAGTGGFASTTAVIAGKQVSISVNATIPVR